MYHLDPRLCWVLVTMRVEEAQGQAGSHRLLRKARAQQPSWMSRQGRRLLGWFGRRLVKAGQLLESHAMGALRAEGESAGAS
jgi:hypothetical protein